MLPILLCGWMGISASPSDDTPGGGLRKLALDPANDSLIHEDAEAGYRVYCKPLRHTVYVVEPIDRPSRGTVLLLHGLGEHAFRFFRTGTELAGHGWQTILLNLTGHGFDYLQEPSLRWLVEGYARETDAAVLLKSMHAKAQDDAALWGEKRRANLALLRRTSVSDHVRQVTDLVERLLVPVPGSSVPRPFFLAGSSLGGLVAAEAARRLVDSGRAQPNGVVLISAALKPAFPPSSGWLTRRAMGLSWRARTRTFSPSGWLMDRAFSLNFDIDVSWGNDWVSDLAPERDLQGVDPAILRTMPSGYLSRIEKQMAEVLAGAADYPCPILVFTPKDDHIVCSEGARRFYRAVRQNARAGQRSVERQYDFSYHELLRSSKRDDVISEMLRWLHARSCEATVRPGSADLGRSAPGKGER